MEFISQRDPRWSLVKLGASNLTMGGFGCTTSCIAMAEGITPDLIAKNAANYTRDGLVLWTAISSRLKNIEFVWRQVSPSERQINEAFADKKMVVLLEVNDGAHWVLLQRKTLLGNDYVAVDPWTGKECNVKKTYHNITKAVYFRRKVALPVTIPEALKRFMGKFIIAPERGGRLFYVTTEGKKVDLGSDAAAVQATVARLAHGMSNENLDKIPNE